jgi:hypothetical protein
MSDSYIPFTTARFHVKPWWLRFTGACSWVALYPRIYYPSCVACPQAFPQIVAHERTHLKQQKEMGLCKWLCKYSFNRAFRLQQEAEAIAVEISKTDPVERNAAIFMYGHSLCEYRYCWCAKDYTTAVKAIKEALAEKEITDGITI